MRNGLQSGVQYCSREEITPTHSGSECSRWIDGSTRRLNRNLNENLKRARIDLDNGIKLTIVNQLQVAWKCHLQYDSLKNDDRLPYVVIHMLDDGFWWLSKSRTEFYVEIFRASCKAGKLTYSSSRAVWSQELWKPSRL